MHILVDRLYCTGHFWQNIFSCYSGVPNKHAARLLISEKISLPTCSIWSYMFIRILKLVSPTLLLEPSCFQNWTKQCKVASIYSSISNNAPFCYKISTIFALFLPLQCNLPPTWLFRPMRLLDSWRKIFPACLFGTTCLLDF